MRDLDFPLFSLSCLKLYGFLWTPFHTPLPQPHCSLWISNNRTSLCLLPCSHVHSQRDIRDAGNRRQWSRSRNAFNYWLLSLLHKLQVPLNSLMRISRAGGGGGSVLLQLLLMPYELYKHICSCKFFSYMRWGEQYVRARKY